MGITQSIPSGDDKNSISPALVKLVNEDRWMAEVTDSRLYERDGYTKMTVHCNSEADKKHDNYTYTLTIAGTDISDSAHIALLFPQHPQHDKRVLYSGHFRSLRAFNQTVHDRLDESATHSPIQLVVLARNVMYLCHSVGHPIYFAWCTKLNVCALNQNIPSRIARPFPILLETNGNNKPRTLLCFDENFYGSSFTDLYPVSLHSVRPHISHPEQLFFRDGPPEDDPLPPPIRMIHQSQAMAATGMGINPITISMAYEEAPFAISCDEEDGEEAEELFMTIITPRNNTSYVVVPEHKDKIADEEEEQEYGPF